jgi:CBS domain-containing protein
VLTGGCWRVAGRAEEKAEWWVEAVAEVENHAGSPPGALAQLRRIGIRIREAMNPDLATVDRDETLRQVARRMVQHGMSGALVEPSRQKSPPGIITDRDLLEMVANAQEPGEERVANHPSRKMTFSAPDWSLKQAAEAITGGFQHVVVVEHAVLSASSRWVTSSAAGSIEAVVRLGLHREQAGSRAAAR